MNKERQKYLTRMLDSYCQPMKRQINLFVLIITLTTIAQVFAITKLVSILITDHTHFMDSWLYLGIVFLTMVIKAVAIYLRSNLTQKVAAQVRSQVREQVVKRCEQLGAKGLGRNTVDLSIFYLEQVELLNNYIARFFPQALCARIQPMLIIVAVFALNWIAGLVLLICLPLLPVFMILIGLKTSELNAKQLKNLLYLGNQFHDKLVGIKTIMAFSRQRATLERMTENSQGYTHTTIQLLRVAFLNSAVLEFLSSVSVALMAVYFGISYLKGFSYGTYDGLAVSLMAGFFCLTLAGEFFQPLRDLGTFYHDRSSALNAMDELEKFINQEAQENQDYVDIQDLQEQAASNNQVTEEEKDDLYDSSFKSIDMATNAHAGRIYNTNRRQIDTPSLQTQTSHAQATPVEQDTTAHAKQSQGKQITATTTVTSTEDHSWAAKTKRRKARRAKQPPVFLDASKAPAASHLQYPFSKALNPDFVFKLDADSLIEAKNLCIFTHSGKELVNNLTFSFSLKEKVAIIGLSGAGKTTLLSCLLGLLPYTGSLKFNGVELTEIPAAQFYPYFSWLGQNPNLDQVSISENLSFNSPYFRTHQDMPPTKIDFIDPIRASHTSSITSNSHATKATSTSRVAAATNTTNAANAANAAYAKYLQELPTLSRLSLFQAIKQAQLEQLVADKGLNYIVQQHNIGLSGGQIQRLALARALIKPHLYLIIDEPTANLDAKLEKAIFSNIQAHQQGILMVTHRLEQSATFDKVYKLSKQGMTLEA